MRASEEQAEAFVPEPRRFVECFLSVARRLPHAFVDKFGSPLAAHPVEEPVPRGDEKPRFGRAGNAVDRPAFQGPRERVGERVLGRADATATPREKREQLSITLARSAFDGVVRGRGAVHTATGMGAIGRTSTVPLLAHGQRAAQAIALSISGTSMM